MTSHNARAASCDPASFYTSVPVQRHVVGDATVAVRVFGQGPAVVLIHGFPVHGYTWRKLLPELSKTFTCYVLDLPGLGDSDWRDDTDFTFTAQARRLLMLFQSLQLSSYALIAHDAGAVLTRLIAWSQPEQVRRLVIINTDMPGHRPPWIPHYQRLSGLPGASRVFGALMRSPAYLRSDLGMGQFYADKRLLGDPASLKPYAEPLATSLRLVEGALSFLRSVEWSIVDSLRERHAQLEVDTLFLWGVDDKTFPVELGEEMSRQFGGTTTFRRVAGAALLPHEEKPDEVLAHLVPFLA